MADAPKERKLPSPEPTPETKEFWDAAASGKFLIKRNKDTGEAHWYPRAICPFTGSANTEWVEASGRGNIYSYSVMRRAPVPYCIAYVTLAEGPTMMTNIVDTPWDEIKVGMAVKLAWKPSEGGIPVPCFAKA